ncbi:MAG: hypothetical protein NTX59_08060 [Elusimicrobia bacterium]|nr:hypothetical protein [Elusimicrobiota bacterium]
MPPENPEELFAALARFGYPLLQPEGEADPNKVLAALAESEDTRLLEGFPVVLAHCVMGKESRLNMETVEKLLSKPESHERFWTLVAVSRYLFDLYDLGYKNWSGFSDPKYQKAWDLVQEKTRNNQPLPFGNRQLDWDRLKKTFLEYVVGSRLAKQMTEKEKLNLNEDFRREYYLSLLLTPRQKDLLYKRLNKEKMTKTEREYFSRVVRKKLVALADPYLHALAQKALL